MVDSLIQREVIAMVGSVRAAGWKEEMTFVLVRHIFMVGMSLVIILTTTHGGSLLKISLVVVNLQVKLLVIITESLL